MEFKSLLFVATLATILSITFGDKISPFAGNVKQVAEIIKKLTEENKVVVENKVGEEIFLKCASGDDDIGWHTLKPDDFIAWSFGSHAGGRTCFWCYANNNGKEARDSNNWYMHFNVWGFNDCPNAPKDQPDVTTIGVKKEGAYYNDQELGKWGPPPS